MAVRKWSADELDYLLDHFTTPLESLVKTWSSIFDNHRTYQDILKRRKKLLLEYPEIFAEKQLTRDPNKPQILQNQVTGTEYTFKYSGPTVAPHLKVKNANANEAGIILLTDFHIGELDLNSAQTYDAKRSDIKKLFDNLSYLIFNHIMVKDLYLAFLGDMIEGQYNYQSQIADSDPISWQTKMMVDILFNSVVPLVDNLNSKGINVHFRFIPGNHGRTGPFRNLQRDNHELTGYWWIKDLLLNRYPKLDIRIADQSTGTTHIKEVIAGKTILFEHGHAIRTYMNIPFYGMLQRILKLSHKFKDHIDAYCIGHLHTCGDWFINDSHIMVSGTLKRFSDLEDVIGSSPEHKFQFFTIDEGRWGIKAAVDLRDRKGGKKSAIHK